MSEFEAIAFLIMGLAVLIMATWLLLLDLNRKLERIKNQLEKYIPTSSPEFGDKSTHKCADNGED